MKSHIFANFLVLTLLFRRALRSPSFCAATACGRGHGRIVAAGGAFRLLVIALYVAVALLDSVSWVGGTGRAKIRFRPTKRAA